ncbi:ATP-binding protein [Sanguibacter sp. 25GB23B1]|uniref:ATP-binding protein n=1 Tax=unclassified Sanguibacter TaxID=2645534 RepID=UPI0032B002FE
MTNSSWRFIARGDLVTRLAGALEPGARHRATLLTGSVGSGKTWLLQRVGEAMVLRGYKVYRVSGRTTSTQAIENMTYVLDSLRARASERVVLLVDDAGGLDAQLLRPLVALVRDGGCRMMLSVTDSEPLPPELIELRTVDLLGATPVSPLSPSEISHLAMAYLGGPLSPRSRRTVVAHAHGNPRALREMLDASTASGVLVWNGAAHELTGDLDPGPRVSDMVALHLASVPAEHLDVLEVLAAGQPLPASAFESEVVDALERDGIVTVSAAPSRQVRFADPVYGAVTRRRASPARWRTAQDQAVRILRTHPGVDDRSAFFRAVVVDVDAGATIAPQLLAQTAAWALEEREFTLARRLARVALHRVPLHLAHEVLGTVSTILGDIATADKELLAAARTALTDDELASVAHWMGVNWGSRHGDPRAAVAHIDALQSRATSASGRAAIAGTRDLWQTILDASLSGGGSGASSLERLDSAMTQAMRGITTGPLILARTAIEAGRPLTAGLGAERPDAAAYFEFVEMSLAALSGDLMTARTRVDTRLGHSGEPARRAGLWASSLGFFELLGGSAPRAQELALDACGYFRAAAAEAPGGSAEREDEAAADALAVAAAVAVGDVAGARAALERITPQMRLAPRVDAPLLWSEARQAHAEGRTAEALNIACIGGRNVLARGETYLAAFLLDVAVRLGRPDLVVDDLARAYRASGGHLVRMLYRNAVAAMEEDFEGAAVLVDELEQYAMFSAAADVSARIAQHVRETRGVDAASTWEGRTGDLIILGGGAGPWIASRRSNIALRTILTSREIEVARHASLLRTVAQTAEIVRMDPRRVQALLDSVYGKLGVLTPVALHDALHAAGLLDHDRGRDRTAPSLVQGTPPKVRDAQDA